MTEELTAYKLLQDGSEALAEVEGNGMRVDVDYLKTTLKRVSRKIQRKQKELEASDVWKTWEKTYKTRANMGSREQLGKILFDVMGLKCDSRTKTGKPKVDVGVLEKINHPFTKAYLENESLKKLKATYLKGILRETVDGFCHPSFNLHLVRTFRSSSDSPNFQNLPIRNPVQGKYIRQCFIPREGRHIVEIDYSGIEVRIAACYHKDPVMLEYIKNPEKDMHRDMAAECYKLKPEQVSKQIRYCGKNMFVFPQFYGSWFPDCARSLWEAADGDLRLVDGTSLREHLTEEGLVRLGACNKKDSPVAGTFEKHIQEVEKDFWQRRFKKYDQWKKEWWTKYQTKGYFNTLTGFKISGVMSRNDAINYPVQGSAFHCLLYSLINIQKELKKRNMKSLLVGQIHDSIVADVPEGELKKYLRIARRTMTEKLCEDWKWINVPLDIEAEATPVNGSWYEKKEITID